MISPAAEHNNKCSQARRVLAAGAEDNFLDCYKPKKQAREAWTASVDGSYRAGTQSATHRLPGISRAGGPEARAGTQRIALRNHLTSHA